MHLFRLRLLQISDGIDHPDGLVWELVVGLVMSWLLVFFSVWKGIKVSGKVLLYKTLKFVTGFNKRWCFAGCLLHRHLPLFCSVCAFNTRRDA